MFKKIHNKIFYRLFPAKKRQIERLFQVNEKLNDVINTLKKQPSPTMADLMRENMGLLTSDFSNAQEDGLPRHFLDTEDKTKRAQYINELAQIYQMAVWEVMCKNHIDTQGNFSFRNADGELQLLSGRMTVNGISMLRKEVKRGFEEYMEGRKPPEEYDEFETTEGIAINNIIENQDANKNK